jgi:hypothetical protein
MTTETHSEVMKDVVDTLCSIFEEGCIDLSSLEYILQKLKTKYPEDFPIAALEKYSELFKKVNECTVAIENGKENSTLEKELEDTLGWQHSEMCSLRTLKRWVAFKNARLVKNLEKGD